MYEASGGVEHFISFEVPEGTVVRVPKRDKKGGGKKARKYAEKQRRKPLKIANGSELTVSMRNGPMRAQHSENGLLIWAPHYRRGLSTTLG